MLTKLVDGYTALIHAFPASWHGPISLVIALLIIGLIWHVIRQSGIWLLLLLILVPALIPVVRDVALALLEFIKIVIGNASL